VITRWTDQVAEFGVGVSVSGIPGDVIDAAVRPIIDTLGVMTAGRRSDAGATALRYAAAEASGAGRGHIVGVELDVPAETAALVNSTMGHALDYDDEMPLGGGHPSSMILGAILALPREEPLTGPELLQAYIVGHEVAAWMAKALGPLHYRKGWHLSAIAGTFGATVGASRLLGLDVGQLRTALGAAASMASGLQRNFGTMTKPLHSGLAARNGVLAAQLAKYGLTAATDVLDGPKGFFDMLGEGGSTPEELGKLGVQWALVNPGSSLKKYPCCYATHRSTDAMLEIQAEYDFKAADVESIQVSVPVGAMAALIYPKPTTGLEGKFSMEYTLAAAFLDRDLRLDTFTEEAVTRPDVAEVMAKVIVKEEPRCRPEDPENKFGRAGSGGFVEVSVQAGATRAVATVAHPSGSAVKPMSWGDMESKFTDCLRYGGITDEQVAHAAFARLRALAGEADVHGVLSELARAGSEPGQS
jgi:2-methylcitrate dehydratase PrpD